MNIVLHMYIIYNVLWLNIQLCDHNYLHIIVIVFGLPSFRTTHAMYVIWSCDQKQAMIILVLPVTASIILTADVPLRLSFFSRSAASNSRIAAKAAVLLPWLRNFL